jgi:hypothetical protein
MNIAIFQRRLIEKGWQDVKPNEFGDVRFDVVAHKRILRFGAKYYLLAKYEEMLDAKTLTTWQASTDRISSKVSSFFNTKPFILILIGGIVESQAMIDVKNNILGPAPFKEYHKGGGAAGTIVVDRKTGIHHIRYITPSITGINKLSDELVETVIGVSE